MPIDEVNCPACDSVEWFPGASCFHCGWEGSAADAYNYLRKRVAELEARAREVLDVFDYPEPDDSGMWLVYNRPTRSAFNWHALGPKLNKLRAAVIAKATGEGGAP